MEDKVIADFRKKTDMNFHLLDGMTAGEIEQIVLFYVQAKIIDYDIDAKIENVVLSGSRCRGIEEKASIYEYKDLLAIMSSGKIEVDNFPGFRLFTVDGKVEYQTYSNNQIDKEIKNNNELFEMIDRSIRYGNIEVDLSRVFENRFIERIEIAHKNEGENWSRLFTYAELIAAKEKFLDKIGNPLKIDNENILFYGDMPLNVLNADENLLIRNEGSQTAKKRNKNFIVFNSEHYSKIHMQVTCNAKILNSGIAADDTTYTKEGKDIIFEFDRDGVSFHRLV